MKKIISTLIALSLSITAIMLISSCQTIETTYQETEEEIVCDFAQLLNSLTINVASNNSASRIFPSFNNFEIFASARGFMVGIVRVIGEHETMLNSDCSPQCLSRPHTITTVEVVEIFSSHFNQSHINIGDRLRVRELYLIEDSELTIFGDSPPMMPGQEYLVYMDFFGEQYSPTWEPCEINPDTPLVVFGFPTRDDVSVDSQDRVSSTFSAFGRVGSFYSRMMHAARDEYLGIPNPLPERAR